MVTDIQLLIKMCKEELADKEYCDPIRNYYEKEWDKLTEWMVLNDHPAFSESIGYQYCDETIGTHIFISDIARMDKILLRATRMLISYQRDGCFEFRTPSVERVFSSQIGTVMEQYLTYLQDILKRTPETIRNYQFYLHDLDQFMRGRDLHVNDINLEAMETFFHEKNYTTSARKNNSTVFKQFFRYLFDIGIVDRNLTPCILPHNYNRGSKLPSTYSEKEICEMLACVERASAIGKRDYVILLLAAEYGWRAKDIVELKLGQIDWDMNLIRLTQSKTEIPVVYPLLASVGNAIIDYLKHGRPFSETDYLILAMESGKKGRPLSRPTVHSIVTKYLRKAGTKELHKKRHGPHSLRHSLATNMLSKNISLPIISTVLGHQTTESTKIYLKVDIEKLRLCPLPIPSLNSDFYKGGQQQ